MLGSGALPCSPWLQSCDSAQRCFSLRSGFTKGFRRARQVNARSICRLAVTASHSQSAKLFATADSAPATSTPTTELTSNPQARDVMVIVVFDASAGASHCPAGEIVLVGEEGKESVAVSLKHARSRFSQEARPQDRAFEVLIRVPEGFGRTGAIKVLRTEELLQKLKPESRFWLERVEVEDELDRQATVASAETYVYAKQGWRTFFTNQVHLPDQTPAGLQALRAQELKTLSKKDGSERQPSDRIYDYDVYNDLGKADAPRPTLAGPNGFPYPRRVRTNRPPNDDGSEQEPTKRLGSLSLQDRYIPADELFSHEKQTQFNRNKIIAGLPGITDTLVNKFKALTGRPDQASFASFADIDNLYDSTIWQESHDAAEHHRHFRGPKPFVYAGRSTAWEMDQEMGRQMLAGQNPCMLRPLTEIPSDSAITPEHLASAVEEKSVQELMSEGRRLFHVDYSFLSSFLPQVNQQKDKDGNQKFYMYASRAVFYLTKQDLLRPVAIELIDAPDSSNPEALVRKVYTADGDADLWRLAKVYFTNNDCNYHQLVSHWLRTHAVTEPYIIATRRNLSAMHPVAALLHPHFKYTMAADRVARADLFGARGFIETTFSFGEYAMRICSDVYDKRWHFDTEGLPGDLVNRGMAIKDPQGDISWKGETYSQVLHDYPYADDGMLIWKALHDWVSAYLKVYYTDDSTLVGDKELMAWWKEIQEKGHPDKEKGWPKLQTVDDLADIITTMLWICSGHHAAVNFGQYSYYGYMPNSPSATHQPMPDESDPAAWKAFKANPERKFLDVVNTKKETMSLLTVAQLLSIHDPEEEYLGDARVPGWTSNPAVLQAFSEFQAAMKSIQETVLSRNSDVSRKARFPGYTLLAPYTNEEQQQLLRGQGVPNSISI